MYSEISHQDLLCESKEPVYGANKTLWSLANWTRITHHREASPGFSLLSTTEEETAPSSGKHTAYLALSRTL